MHDVDALRILLTVAEEGSFSGAAKKLHLTQPAVSFQIAALEDEYNALLFERGPRGVTLTEAGMVVYKYALEITRLLARSEQDVAELAGMVRGTLTIAASTVPGDYILPKCLARFGKLYPGITISLSVSDSGGVKESVLSGQADIGVVGARYQEDNLVYQRFASDELVVIAPPGHPLVLNGLVKPEDLLEHPFVMRESSSGTRTVFENALASAGVRPDKIKSIMITGSTQSVKTAVEAGFGISVISRWAMGKEAALGTLVPVPVGGLDLRREFYLIRRAGGPRTFAAKRFWEEILTTVPEGPSANPTANPGVNISSGS